MGILVSEPNCPYLCFAESINFLKNICAKEEISCVICTPDLAESEFLLKSGKGIAVCNAPRTAFYSMHNWLAKNRKEYLQDVKPKRIGTNCIIHPTSIIEDGVEIGNNVIIEEYVVIRCGTKIGNNVILRAGCVVGGSNQIVSHYEDGTLFLVEQTGNVILEDNIEVGYHALIACGMFPYEKTVIKSNTCIDALVVIAHNSQIGNNVMVLGQAQVCGSTVIGDGVRISPQSIVSNCLEVGNEAVISLGAVVVNNVKEKTKVSGNFAIEHSSFLKWHLKKLKRK